VAVADVEAEPAGGEVEVRVVGVRWAAGEDGRRRHAVVLREADGDRGLHIWIGKHEAVAVTMALEGPELPRPDTYRFAAGLLVAAGARLAAVALTGVVEGTFHAEAVVEGPAGVRRLDARPSDAINLALATGAPVRAAVALLEGP
jgi:uncharacterized protein